MKKIEALGRLRQLLALTSCLAFQTAILLIDLVKDYLLFWVFDVSPLVACE